MLQEKGVHFVSETDTKVVAQLIGHFYEGNILHAVQKTVPLLKGSFAIVLFIATIRDKSSLSRTNPRWSSGSDRKKRLFLRIPMHSQGIRAR